MSEGLLLAYYIGAAIVFVVGLLRFERIDGRTCTGEPDVVLALLVAAIWPLVIIFFVALAIQRALQEQEK